ALDVVGDDRRDRDVVIAELAVALDRVEGREAVGDLALHVGVEVVGVDRVAADLHPQLLVEVAGVVVGAAAAGEREGGAGSQGSGEGVTGLHGVSPVVRAISGSGWSVGARRAGGRRFSYLRRRRAPRSPRRPPGGTRRRARRR